MTNQLIHVRAFPSEISRSGPRQLTGRLVPYDSVADVLDELPDGKLDVYQEGFRAGAFGAQAQSDEPRAFAKISLVHRHEGGLGFLGPFTALREQADGLYGDVAVLRSKADDVEDLLAAGVNELSVEFRVPRAQYTHVDDAGVRWRTRAHLDQVALEPKGAYGNAQVLAYRAEVDAEKAEAEAAAEAQRQQAEADVEAAAHRRDQFRKLTSRLDSDLARQADYMKTYGLTVPRKYMA
jgi:HK97 family phage prohead protease